MQVEVSIHELLAAAREAVKSDYIKGASILCETRYHPDTHYMVEIEMLKTDNANVCFKEVDKSTYTILYKNRLFKTLEEAKKFKENKQNCIFRKNRALAPHERSAVPLGTDYCPVC